MKNIYLLLITSLVLVSCGGDSKKSVENIISEGNLADIRAKKVEITAKKEALEADIKLLEERISELDSVKKLPLVTIFKAKESKFDHSFEVQGNVETKQNIVIYPEYSGILTRVYVKEGQQVSKGQLLASIDDGGMSQQLAQIQVQAELAKTTYERQKRLWDQKIGSEIQFLQAKSSYESTQNAVNQMKNQLAKTSVTAPFSGVIDNIITEQGSVVVPGQSQLIRIVNLKDMYIEAEVPESYIPSVTKGKDVEIFFPILGKTINSKVRQVSNYINPNNRSFKIEVSVPENGGLIKPNLTAKLRINDYTNDKAILIPQSVISENADGEQYAYITAEANDSSKAKAIRAIIKTGKRQGDYVEVLSGIKHDDNVILEGARSVSDGQSVEILKTATDEQK